MPRPKSNKESERLRRIVHEHLRRRASLAHSPTVGTHLDEDALNAFVEGRLSETESAPLIKHLVSCGTCRHITAQLVRLEMEVAGDDVSAPLPTEKPSHIRSFLSELASRVLPTSDEDRSEEHTSELQSLRHLVCRLLLEKKKKSTQTSA